MPPDWKSLSVYAAVSEEGAGTTFEPLLRRAQTGDAAAFGALIEARLPALFRLALAILGDELDARDAVQLACVDAWRGLPRLRGLESFDPWLKRILTNQCRISLRGRRRRRVREIPVSHLDVDGDMDALGGSVAGPADRTADLEILERAFERLDADARILLALHYLEDLSLAEISTRVSLSLTTVKWRLHRARAALEGALELERR